MLAALTESRTFARTFDADGVLRFAFWEAKLMGDSPPDLVAQRVDAGGAALGCLKALRSESALRAIAEPRLLELCRDLLHEYSESEKHVAAPTTKKPTVAHSLSPPTNLAKAATPLALDALNVVKGLDSETFARHCSWLVPVLSELIVCNSVDVRTAVAAVFATRLPTALAAHTNKPLTTVVEGQPVDDDDLARRGEPTTPDRPTSAEDPRDTAPRQTPRHPGAVVKPYRLFESQ